MDDVEIEKRDSATIALLKLSEMHLGNMSEITKIINKQLEERPKNFIMDFSKVTFIDSSAIGLLMGTQKTVSSYGGKFCLTNIGPNLIKLFKLTHLDRFIKIYTTVDEVMQNINKE